MADSYDRGDTAALRIEIRNAAGALVDPGTLELAIRTPAGVTTTETYPADAALVRDGTGLFHRDLPLSEDGVYGYQWKTTNPGQVQGGRITVRPAPLDVLPWSLSLEALKVRLGARALAAEDGELLDYLAAAVEQAQAHPPYGCGRLLIPDPAAADAPAAVRTITMTGRSIRVPDARELTEVLVDGVAAEYRSLWRDGHIVALTFARQSPALLDAAGLPAQRTVRLTGRFGFVAIPPDLLEAIYLLAGRYHYEKDAWFADQVAALEGTTMHGNYRPLPAQAKAAFAAYAVAAGAGFTLS